MQSFVTIFCYRAGVYIKSDSKVAAEFQRKRATNKCDCKFTIKLKAIGSGRYEIYSLHGVHNHELHDDSELAQLSFNRMIPEDVKTRMLELHSFGVLNTSQIMILIESEFNIPITWTKRDVQLSEC